MMKKIEFDFLKDLELNEVKKGEQGSSKPKTQRQPEGKRLRLFKDGSVYPSDELIEALLLEYRVKDDRGSSNGLDIFSAQDWGQWPSNQPNNMVFVTTVPKTHAKVDLFGSVKYDANGLPKMSVKDQGSSTFGKNVLIPMLNATYEDDFFADGKAYLDLEVRMDQPLPQVNNGIYHLPKQVARGEHKGQWTYERREGLIIYPLIPVMPESLENGTPDAAAKPESLVHESASLTSEQEPVTISPEDTSDLTADNDAFNASNIFNV